MGHEPTAAGPGDGGNFSESKHPARDTHLGTANSIATLSPSSMLTPVKNLLFPTLAVVMSALGTGYGCHLAGMPNHDIEIAVLVAAIVASGAASAAMILASRRRPRSSRIGATPTS